MGVCISGKSIYCEWMSGLGGTMGMGWVGRVVDWLVIYMCG